MEKLFRRQLGVSPMAYLRDVRLVRVQEELRVSSPKQTTVRTVAERWGFSHAGRFASTYRKHLSQAVWSPAVGRDAHGLAAT
ncbi:helix-turn-helix domain-containing protein [Mycolicibacterium sp. YH-1]|uniref:helix-turn-helix domain-containing protein n=1 Tax=Mycolicibacterium sp. YH-1 TaxID=2908837 RepID=UPI00352F28FE